MQLWSIWVDLGPLRTTKADLQGGAPCLEIWTAGNYSGHCHLFSLQGGAPCLASLILVFLKMILWVFFISENPKQIKLLHVLKELLFFFFFLLQPDYFLPSCKSLEMRVVIFFKNSIYFLNFYFILFKLFESKLTLNFIYFFYER